MSSTMTERQREYLDFALAVFQQAKKDGVVVVPTGDEELEKLIARHLSVSGASEPPTKAFESVLAALAFARPQENTIDNYISEINWSLEQLLLSM